VFLLVTGITSKSQHDPVGLGFLVNAKVDPGLPNVRRQFRTSVDLPTKASDHALKRIHFGRKLLESPEVLEV
jgi:hypothetical protein